MMKQKPKKIDIVKFKLNYWRSFQNMSFVGARKLWLYFNDKKLPVPEDVFNVFVERIRKDAKKYKNDQAFKDKRLDLFNGRDEGYVIYKFVSFQIHHKGKSKDKAYWMCVDYFLRRLKKKEKQLKEKHPLENLMQEKLDKKKETINYDSVKKAFQRTEKMVLNEGEYFITEKKPHWFLPPEK